MKNKIKIIILLAVILVVSIAVISKNFNKDDENIVPVFETPKEDDSTADNGLSAIDISDEAIAGWDTCRNEEYGYEFKYPKGWYMYKVSVKYEVLDYLKISTCEGQFITISPEENLTTLYFQDHPSGIEVRMHTNNENNSLKEYLRRFHTDNRSQRLTILKEESVNKAKIIWYDFYGFTEVMFSHKDNLFNIRVRPRNQPDFLNAILSTLKFID